MPLFDAPGTPKHDRGITADPALSFLSLPWQYSWGPGRFPAEGRDAVYLAEHIDPPYQVRTIWRENIAA